VPRRRSATAGAPQRQASVTNALLACTLIDKLVTVGPPLLETLERLRSSNKEVSCLRIECSQIEVSQYSGNHANYCIAPANMKREASALLTLLRC